MNSAAVKNATNIEKSILKIGFDVTVKQSAFTRAQTACHWEHVFLVDLFVANPLGLFWCPTDTICYTAVRQADYMTSKSTRKDYPPPITSPCRFASCYSIQQLLFSTQFYSFTTHRGLQTDTVCATCMWKQLNKTHLIIRSKWGMDTAGNTHSTLLHSTGRGG